MLKLPQMIAALLLCQLLLACQETTIPEKVIRPAQVWTISDQHPQSASVYSGEIKARYEADLAFRVSGKLTKRLVDSGDRIKVGQTIANVDTTDLNLAIQSAEANVRTALSAQATAQADFERNRDLYKKHFLSESALDTYVNQSNAATENVKAARAQLDIAKNQATYTALRADKSGIITAVTAEVGQVVAAGQAIAHVAYDGEREVQIRVGEAAANALTPGTPAQIQLWSEAKRELAGKVREVSPAADSTRSFLVKIALLDAPQDLRLGMTADVSFATQVQDNTHWIPASALFQQNQQPAVWILKADNTVQLQPITVLAYRADGVTMTGLNTKTVIIAAGVHKLTAGQTVNPVPYDGKAGL